MRTSLFLVPSLVILFLLVLLPDRLPAVPEGVTLSWPGGTEGKVFFDGTLHAKKGLMCDVCHVTGKFHTRKGANPMTMDALKKEQYCGSCHNGKKAFGTKDKTQCGRCHKR